LAARLVAAWMESPGHRENLLHPQLNHAGSATRIVRDPQRRWWVYAVQVFARHDPSLRNPRR
jgi:uncharacterized protein YkwD